MRTLILAALMVVALGVAWGVYVLVGHSDLNLPTLAPGRSSEKTPAFTPYPSVSLSADDRKDFDSRIAKLAMNRLVEYSKMEKDKNVVFSPVCSMSTLGMLLAAADGDTEATILDELCMKGRSSAWVLNSFRQYFDELEKLDKDIPKNAGDLAGKPPAEEGWFASLWRKETPRKPLDMFRTANSMWSNSRLSTRAGLTSDIMSYLSGDTFSTPFDSTTPASVDAWISRRSSCLIKSLNLKDVEGKTALAAVSAAMFCSRWSGTMDEPFFPEENTKDKPFSTSSGTRRDCPFMELKARWSYLETPHFKALEIPYSLSGTRLRLILPGKDFHIEELLTQLTTGGLKQNTAGFQDRLGTVRLPKFDYRCVFEKKPMITVANGLVLNRAFTEKPLEILETASRQTAEISIDEYGTRAIAVEIARTWDMCTIIGEPPPFDLTFDRPFAFFIMYGDSEIPLFAGIVNDPCEHGDK